MALTAEHADPRADIDGTGLIEPTEQIDLLMRDLRSSPQGLSQAEAAVG
jgi:hypothetical protein